MDLRERPSQPFERHPWEIARARFVAGVLRGASVLPGANRVVDVGSGDAWLAGELAAANPSVHIVCWDVHYTGDDIAALSRGNIEAVRDAPHDQRFDLACALDVLEHVDDDRELLDQICALVVPGGHLMITVPSHQALWSHHDELLEHRRRYSRRALLELLAGAELEVLGCAGFFHSLIIPRAVTAFRERLSGANRDETAAGGWDAPPSVTRAVNAALRIDNAFSRLAARVSVPLPGLSLWALCRRPS